MTDGIFHLTARYGEEAAHLEKVAGAEKLRTMIDRGSCRAFQKRALPQDVIELLCAAALASPTKSDLQQRDIVIVRDPKLKQGLIELMSTQHWISEAPCLLVFCGNNRRQRRLHELRRRAFVNDHLDAFFNAAVDAGVALSAFVAAAETLGLGCCPISAIRNAPMEVSQLLSLPDYVFPVAGLALGYPSEEQPKVSPRLPLSATIHLDRFEDSRLDEHIERYDARRRAEAPYANQRSVERFGPSPDYGWSEDKARQYALPERQDFGEFVRKKGFDLS